MPCGGACFIFSDRKQKESVPQHGDDQVDIQGSQNGQCDHQEQIIRAEFPGKQRGVGRRGSAQERGDEQFGIALAAFIGPVFRSFLHCPDEQKRIYVHGNEIYGEQDITKLYQCHSESLPDRSMCGRV